jgi:hypothetical protein
MRGIVEIYSGDKLVYKEDNLVVDGASELLADIMTVSPSLSGIEDHATSSILDASNYTIQAISFGKDASAYQYNAHAMNSRRNLITFSTPSDAGPDSPYGDDNWSITNTVIDSVPQITPPPQYANVPSSIAHVVSVVDESNSTNGTISYSQGLQYDWTLSGGQDNWYCVSVYLKSPVDEAAVLPVPNAPDWDPDISYRHPAVNLGMTLRGEGWETGTTGPVGYGGLGYSRLNTTVSYSTNTTPNYTDPSSISFAYAIYDGETNLYRGTDYGYSIDRWQQNGGSNYEGDGWHRQWVAGLAPVSGLSAITFNMYPTTFESDPTGITQGGVYTYGWQLEMGRWPTELQFNNQNYQFNNWDVSGSVLNRDHSPGAIEDNGTVRVVPPYGTSSYVPTNYLSSPPDPTSTRVEEGDTALFDTSCSVLSGFNMGQNLNVIPYREQGDQLPKFLRCMPFNRANGQDQYDWLKNHYAESSEVLLSGLGSLGPQAYYLGCFPEGSSTGGSNWALVSSLDSSAAYPVNYVPSSSPYFVSGTYNSVVNEASSMDVSGFVNMVMSGSPGTTTNYLMSSTVSGLCVSGGIDATNSGTVEYSMLLGSGDVGYSNLYGGIYNMGLWTIDMNETLKAGNTPPYSFGPLNNPRKYKLFATKHLTKNLGYIEDDGFNPGALNYTDLTIKWRLHFL